MVLVSPECGVGDHHYWVGFLYVEHSGTTTSPAMKNSETRALGYVEVTAGNLKQFKKELQIILHSEKEGGFILREVFVPRCSYFSGWMSRYGKASDANQTFTILWCTVPETDKRTMPTNYVAAVCIRMPWMMHHISDVAVEPWPKPKVCLSSVSW
jgi:hypothetical protein